MHIGFTSPASDTAIVVRQGGDPPERSLLKFGAWSAALLVLAGCSDTAPPVGSINASIDASSCGAHYSQVAATYDSLLDANGIPLIVDSSTVCVTWMGNDYAYQSQSTGGTDWWNGTAPYETGLAYQNGTATPLDATGGQAGEAISTAGTMMDFINADGATRDAVLDDPYYSIRAVGECDQPDECGSGGGDGGGGDGGGGGSGGGGGGGGGGGDDCDPDILMCDDEDPPMMSIRGATSGPIPAATRVGSIGAQKASTPADTLRFRRHGLKRRGVRALVDGGTEIGRSERGHRRFQVVRGNERVTFHVHPRTGLLAAEEWTGPRGKGRTTRLWRKVRGGYVMAQAETRQVDFTPEGAALPSHSITIFGGVTIR